MKGSSIFGKPAGSILADEGDDSKSPKCLLISGTQQYS
jgi:hypothetical protein